MVLEHQVASGFFVVVYEDGILLSSFLSRNRERTFSTLITFISFFLLNNVVEQFADEKTPLSISNNELV